MRSFRHKTGDLDVSLASLPGRQNTRQMKTGNDFEQDGLFVIECDVNVTVKEKSYKIK
jgi:hypothetical protein